ncbi:hypothetical protein [Enterobacter sp. JMULE2]|uniref:hypothetical protein n=1 Tax=Enterobacter sp. JMULE2 TaxID=2518340 RepID=UPI0020C8F5CD|nr:hypothetical protein [Enterobacter sp. JMULE2]
MSNTTETVHGSGKTGMQANGIKANHATGTRLYFMLIVEHFLLLTVISWSRKAMS